MKNPSRPQPQGLAAQTPAGRYPLFACCAHKHSPPQTLPGPARSSLQHTCSEWQCVCYSQGSSLSGNSRAPRCTSLSIPRSPSLKAGSCPSSELRDVPSSEKPSLTTRRLPSPALLLRFILAVRNDLVFRLPPLPYQERKRPERENTALAGSQPGPGPGTEQTLHAYLSREEINPSSGAR